MTLLWVEQTLAQAPLEIIDGDRGKAYPKHEDFSVDGHCLFLSATNVTRSGLAFSNCQFISEQKDGELRKGKLKRNDVVLTTRGTLGNSAFYGNGVEYDHVRINSGMVILRTDQARLLPEFLYSFLRSPGFENQVEQLRSGVAQPQLPIRDLSKIRMVLPPVNVQRKVVELLSPYDGLIENNRRRIELLEESARQFFREWFVRLRFPGYEHTSIKDGVPEGWARIPLFDLAVPTYGYPFQSSLFQGHGEGLPVVRIRDVLAGESKTFTVEEAPANRRLSNGDILIGMDGDFHIGLWSGGDAWLNQRVVKFASNGRLNNYLLFWVLQDPIRFFNETISGTTVAHLGAKELKTITVLLPPHTVLDAANQFFEPVGNQIVGLKVQNQKLRAARDLLLPRLMSGELAV